MSETKFHTHTEPQAQVLLTAAISSDTRKYQKKVTGKYATTILIEQAQTWNYETEAKFCAANLANRPIKVTIKKGFLTATGAYS
jgi:hypothetical protein